MLPDPIRIFILGSFFFLIGIIASHYKDSIISFSKKWKFFLIVLFMTLGYYIFKESYNEYFRTFNVNALYSSWRPSTLFYSIISGVTFLSLFEKINFKKLSSLSFLVFFLHTLVLEVIWKYAEKLMAPNFYFDLLFFVSVTSISITIAYIVHSIPHLSKVTG
jgi:hypothetical protein